MTDPRSRRPVSLASDSVRRSSAARSVAPTVRAIGSRAILLAACAIGAVLAADPLRPAAAGDPELGQACCLPDGGCVDLPANGLDLCVDFLGGTLMGPGSTCDTSTCIGACCFDDMGDCVEGFGAGDCVDLGGTFGGFGTTCEPEPCDPVRGACCLPDGTCVAEVTENFCLLSLDGVWNGAGSSCATTVCCIGDVTGDGTTNFDDLVSLLGAWGACLPVGFCTADLDHDGAVGFTDLTLLLSGYGACAG